MKPEKIARAFDAVLDDERSALIAGAFDRLETIAADKLRLLEAAQAAGASADERQWRALRVKNARNGALLEGAQRGLQDGRARLELIRNGGAALTTYDRYGQTVQHGGSRAKVEKRA